MSSLVKKGDLVEKDAWRPWFNTLWPDMPAGTFLQDNGVQETHGISFTLILVYYLYYSHTVFLQ